MEELTWPQLRDALQPAEDACGECGGTASAAALFKFNASQPQQPQQPHASSAAPPALAPVASAPQPKYKGVSRIIQASAYGSAVWLAQLHVPERGNLHTAPRRRRRG
jgi:hypothetical protein